MVKCPNECNYRIVSLKVSYLIESLLGLKMYAVPLKVLGEYSYTAPDYEPAFVLEQLFSLMERKFEGKTRLIFALKTTVRSNFRDRRLVL